MTKSARRAAPEDLFPEVAPVRKQPTRASRAPAPVVSAAVVARPSPAPSAKPTPQPRRRRGVALGAVAIAALGLAGFLGNRLLAPETDGVQTARSTHRAPIVGSPSIETGSSSPARDASTPASIVGAPHGSLVAASTLAASPGAAPAPTSTSEVATALKSLAAAAQTRDQAALEAARASLERLVAENPTAAFAAVMAALRGEKDPQSLAVLSSVLLDDALARRPEVAEALTEMARLDAVAARRATAVRTLGNLPGGDASRVDLLGGMERSDADPSVRGAAAVALGVVGDRSPGPVAAAAAKNLVDAVATETDPNVRSMLLYAVHDTRDPAVADALLDALTHDSDSGPRLAAADMLGDVAAAYRSRAVDALAAQFDQESDARMRATIVTSIVSAGRLSAIPVLRRLRGDSGDLQTTIDDYLAGLTSGEDCMDKLEAIKLARENARAR